ncbi:MAG: diguanylate cyclase [Sphingomonas pseudosanguinis]|uniref:ligand-binding sensor domain-containing diguanylate cyclase n=1 Tax=Sphingomonas pseudosanguinis TaxID=413712 RepID=UPI00391D52E3
MTLLRSVGAAALLLIMATMPWASAGAADPWAAWRSASFTNLGDAMGLPHVTTTAIVRAKDGTMWIGTRGGLTRYDGQRVRTFKQVATDRRSLPDNYVRALLALDDGGILIGTNVGGVARFDPATGRFVRLSPTSGHIGGRISSLAPDGAGGAFIASDEGVHHYVRSKDMIDPMTASAIPLEGSSRRQGAFAVHRDPDGTLWAGCEQGLWAMRPGTRRFERMFVNATHSVGDVWSILRDRKGRLWVGTGSKGVYVSTTRGPRPQFTQLASLAESAPLIAHRTIRALMEDDHGRIWIGTDGAGIVLVDPARNFSASALRRVAANPTSLAGDTVRALALDGNGGIWAATELGASRTRGQNDNILRIGSAMPRPEMALADDNVRSILVDRRDRLWLGLSDGSVDQLDRQGERVRHIKLHGHHAGQDIKALLDARDGTILIGARGVIAIDPQTLAQRDVPTALIEDLPVISLGETATDLLIGTYKGLFLRNRATGAVRQLQHEATNPDSLPNNEIINIVPLSDDDVLLATPAGMARLDLRTGRVVTYANNVRDPFSLPQNYVGSIIPDGRNIWAATYGGVAFGRSHGTGWNFRALAETQGLAGDNVASLALDDRRRLWAAGAGGISVIDPRQRSIHVMSRRDGLTINAFNQRAAARTADGSLLFGSPDGLIILNPDALLARRHDAEAGRLIVSEAEIDGQAMPIDSAARQPALDLGREGRTLRLGFSLTDYDAPEEIRYSYWLEGFDRGWMIVPAGTPASATYTNLPAGEYWLRLRAQVPGLAAQTVTHRVHIMVAPQWYETWPARILGALLAALALGGAFWLVTAVVRRRARVLEAMVERRTSELRDANAQLDRLASTDPLTSLDNRRTLMATIDAAVMRARDRGEAFVFALLDVDHFKRVNDDYGHGAGDAVLVAIAAAIRAGVRSQDVVARYGGEEIAILFPRTTKGEALGIVERVRQMIASSPIMADGQSIAVTLSAGVAAWRSDEEVARMIRRADEALYRAKRNGRNQVEPAHGD